MAGAESLGRLKQLVYLNLALNNILRIENLQGDTMISRGSPQETAQSHPAATALNQAVSRSKS